MKLQTISTGTYGDQFVAKFLYMTLPHSVFTEQLWHVYTEVLRHQQ